MRNLHFEKQRNSYRFWNRAVCFHDAMPLTFYQHWRGIGHVKREVDSLRSNGGDVTVIESLNRFDDPVFSAIRTCDEPIAKIDGMIESLVTSIVPRQCDWKWWSLGFCFRRRSHNRVPMGVGANNWPVAINEIIQPFFAARSVATEVASDQFFDGLFTAKLSLSICAE